MTADFRAKLLLTLAEADQSFTETRDYLEALSWVRLAIKEGLPLPPGLREWMCKGIEGYINDADASVTLGAALGLRETARADPRRAPRRGHGPLWASMARMFVLQLAGATVRQAAELVAALSAEHGTASTLEDRYRRSGYGAKVVASRGYFRHLSEVRKVLDDIEKELLG